MQAFCLSNLIPQEIGGFLGFSRFGVCLEPIRLAEKFYSYILFQEAAILVPLRIDTDDLISLGKLIHPG